MSAEELHVSGEVVSHHKVACGQQGAWDDCQISRTSPHHGQGEKGLELWICKRKVLGKHPG